VKPPAFEYHDPTSLAEALDLLALYGDAAKVLAGGQSLMPLLNFRLAKPAHVVDLNRGTLGGSLAHADPAAELPAVVVAVDAQLTLQSKSGQRVLAAEDFFLGEVTTALHPNELLVRLDVPVARELTDSRSRRPHLPGAYRVLRRWQPPIRVRAAEASLLDAVPTESTFAEAGRIVTSQLDPVADIHASADYRKRVAGVLTQRALAASVARVPV
jgi:aerobic carbon-monoxide dehydrogenase medium subunit